MSTTTAARIQFLSAVQEDLDIALNRLREEMCRTAANVGGELAYQYIEDQIDDALDVGALAVHYSDTRAAFQVCTGEIVFLMKLRDEEEAGLTAYEEEEAAAITADKLDDLAGQMEANDDSEYLPDVWYNELGEMSSYSKPFSNQIRTIWKSSRMAEHDLIIMALRMVASIVREA